MLPRARSLEDSYTTVIRYPHFIAFFRFLHIYYNRNFKKNQIWREARESNTKEQGHNLPVFH